MDYHQTIIGLTLVYSLLGFFLACLIAATLSIFRIISIDKDIKVYLFGTLLVSLGGIVLAYFQDFLKTPSQVSKQLDAQVQEEAIQKADSIITKATEKKLVYIQVAH